jgi:hypothetical protein
MSCSEAPSPLDTRTSSSTTTGQRSSDGFPSRGCFPVSYRESDDFNYCSEAYPSIEANFTTPLSSTKNPEALMQSPVDPPTP